MPNLCDKESYDCNDLIKIVGILRSPEGCPWDRAQDHHTIRNNFLEEAYEAVEAIDLESSALLREELGDVLLQIALHSQMEAEQGHFDFNDVCTGICRTSLAVSMLRMLRRRHKTGNSRNARKKDFTVWRIVCGRFPALYQH